MSRFLCAVTAAFAALAVVAGPCAADDDVYTVGNYPVDADAGNAVAAKEKALAEGQEAAFRSLLKRLVPVTEYDRLKRLSALKSGGFFEGVSVRSERNSSTRYIASLDFSYRADSVRSVLQQEGIPFVEQKAREVIVVPVVRDASGAVDTGSAQRAWSSAWTGLDLEHTLAPMEIKPLQSGLGPDALKAAAEGRGAGRALAAAYGSPYVILAVAEPDPASKRLNVTLSGIDAVGGINLRRAYKVFDGDTGYAMELAAVVGQGVLEGRWKAQKTGGSSSSVYSSAPTSSNGTPVSLRAQYQSLAEWSEMRRQLLGLPGVEDLRIEAETARAADVTVRFPGGANELATALYGRGLAVENGADRLILRPTY
jgi:hypothetical protein